MKDEKNIIKGCQSGDKKYQYELVKQYSGMLLSVCRRYSNDEPSAKDILQNTLIKIFKYINKYKAMGSFEAWMRKIAVRCSIDYVTKKYLKIEMLPIELPNIQMTRPEIYSQFDMEDIILLIQNLTPSLRTVFNLNVIEGYSHKEIAELLGISESTSRTNLVRARKCLQDKLEPNFNNKSKSA